MPLLRGEKIALFATAHFVASVVVFLAAIGDTGRRFDSGAPPTVSSHLFGWLSDLLLFPLVTAAYKMRGIAFSGVSGWIPFFVNSALWGGALYFASREIARRRRARAPGV